MCGIGARELFHDGVCDNAQRQPPTRERVIIFFVFSLFAGYWVSLFLSLFLAFPLVVVVDSETWGAP